MNILLTGANGMVGKNIQKHHKFQNYNFFCPSSQILNLYDFQAIKQFLNNYQIEFIIHCAGQVGGIEANLRDQVGFLNNNLLMGYNLVNAALQCSIPRLINLASSCMYPRNYRQPLKEEYILQGQLESSNEGYALAKITIAKLCQYISTQYNLSYKTLIPCNLYGKWDKFTDTNSHMIPAVIKKIHLAKINNLPQVQIWGDGLARREYMYGEDCANAIFFTLENFEKIDPYTNIGVGYDFTINQYYENISSIIGFSGELIHDTSKPSGMQHKLVDISKMKSLGWQANFTLEQGINKTYEFYLSQGAI